ncbi:MAG: glutathione S-transferase C-terminal domain-containing protein [Deltaproteobacteria bacterium]|nr:glutathione S-transferase C-terminal domain-containing protein [Deltaproteobacteria bacterium]
MELYFSPLACSMATRIAFYEVGIEGKFISVDTKSKRLADGSDFLAVNAMGQVPVLRTDTGELLTENPVVLQYVADQNPQSGLAPQSGMARYRLQQWLNFITSELHKVVFIPLLDPSRPQEAKIHAREKAERAFSYLNNHLDGKDYLLDGFTVADAYLITVLNWAKFTGVDLARWPALKAYTNRLYERPSVAKALTEELALFEEQQARRAAKV